MPECWSSKAECVGKRKLWLLPAVAELAGEIRLAGGFGQARVALVAVVVSLFRRLSHQLFQLVVAEHVQIPMTGVPVFDLFAHDALFAFASKYHSPSLPLSGSERQFDNLPAWHYFSAGCNLVRKSAPIECTTSFDTVRLSCEPVNTGDVAFFADPAGKLPRTA